MRISDWSSDVCSSDLGAAFEIVRGQREIGRLDGVLHGQVQAGGRLAAARYSHQDDVSLVQLGNELPVVVRQAEIDGVDAVAVLFRIGRHVRTADRMAGFQAQSLFDMADESRSEEHTSELQSLMRI